MRKFLALLSALTPVFLTGQILPKMALIPGGTFVMGRGGYDYTTQGPHMFLQGKDPVFDSLNHDHIAIGEVPAPNTLSRQVTISNFYLAETEITNREYREFVLSDATPKERERLEARFKALEKSDPKNALNHLIDSLNAHFQPKGKLPNQGAWMTDFPFAFNEPLTLNYFWHPAFDEYPVVGVTHAQALDFCQFISNVQNNARKTKGLAPLPDFRLPSEAEWEYAAYGIIPIQKTGPEGFPRRMYPWPGNSTLGEKGNQLANIKTDHGDYIGDWYEYTAPVTTFKPNGFGLYNMAGNVAEWVADSYSTGSQPLRLTPSPNEESAPASHVVKGGSWADYRYAARCASRSFGLDGQGYSRIGFRVAQIFTGE